MFDIVLTTTFSPRKLWPYLLLGTQMKSTTPHELEVLIAGARSLVGDIEKLLQNVEGQSIEEIKEMQSCITKKMHEFKQAMLCVEQNMLDCANDSIKTTKQYVHDSPWQAAAIAGVFAVVSAYGVRHLFRTK